MKGLNIFKKIIAMILLVLTAVSTFGRTVFAAENTMINNGGDCGFHLQYYNNERGGWYYIICNYVTYNKDGVNYPAYCVNSDLPGVTEHGDYEVTVEGAISNVELWRAIINGYPYRSPQELGVDNEFDAFLATKQSVYCILYGYDPTTRFKGGDARGQRIADAIVRIVNEGRYGTITPQDGTITATKSGDLYAEGDYYVQKFNVSSLVDISSYSITGTENMPVNSFITNENGVQINYFNGAESFYLKIPKSSMNSDLNVVINIQGRCKTYPVFYGKSTIEGTQNYAMTFDAYGDGTGRATLNVKTNAGKIEVNKTDKENGKVIEGTYIQLLTSEGKVLETKVTDKNGKVYFTDLYQGNYKVKESKANSNYILNSEEQSVNVGYNQTVNVNITNERKKSKIKVIKVDKDNKQVKIEGVEFEVQDNNGKVVDTITTDKNGEATTKDLPINETYKVVEKKTRKEYVLTDKVETIILKENEIPNITFENEKKKGQIKVIKVDKDNNEIKLEGVKFEVLNEKGNVVDTITTDSNGMAVTKRIPIDQTYTVKEIETQKTYVLNKEIQTVKLDENQIKNITFENEKKKGSLKIYKVDKDNNKIGIGNVEFELYSDEFKKVIGTYKTDVNGEIKVDKLRIGTYTLKEKSTNKWYNLTEDRKIEIKYKETTEVTIENELKKGAVKIIKVDKENKEVKLEGVKFEVLDEKDNVLEQIVTNKNGEATTSKYPVRDYSKLKIKETETLEEYALNDKIETIELKENQIKNITFENEKIKGKIEIVKVSKDDNKITGDKKGTPIKGAEFKVLDKDGKIVEKIVTDKDGKAITKELYKGEYTVVEVSSGNKYYLVNENEFKAEIKKHKETISVKVEEESVDVDIEVKKTGFIETQSKDSIYYDFENIHNKSNVALDNFTWKDTLPTNALTANRIYTGTYNEDLEYSVWYKTNLKDEYVMLVDKLKTTVNNEVKFTGIEFAEGEFITDIEFRFGTVKPDFREVEKPRLYCDMRDGLGNGFVFTNHTMVSGNYYDVYVEDKDDWKTITYYKEIETTKKLPKTGC